MDTLDRYISQHSTAALGTAGKPSDPDTIAARRRRPADTCVGRPGHIYGGGPCTREQLEKSRLETRTGAFERYSRRDIQAPFATDPNSSMFQDETKRLQSTSTADELKKQRYAQQSEYQNRLLRARYETQSREDQRWQRMEAQNQAEAQRIQAMRQTGLKAKRNEASVPYDLITLNYGSSDEAQRLRARDEMTRYRAELRAHNLTVKQNMHGTNPITGESMNWKPVPVRPSGYGSSNTSSGSSSSSQ